MHARKWCISQGPPGYCAIHTQVQLILPADSSLHTNSSWIQREIRQEFGSAPILDSPLPSPLASLS